MLDIIQRYAPIIAEIKKKRFLDKTIVEIGGTGDGIGHYLPNYKIVDCDITFVDKPLQNTKTIKLTKNQKRIPLKTNYSDVVVCVDTLEHLPTPQRKQAMVNEIIRLARKEAIIAVPVGDKSLKAVKKLYTFLKQINPEYKDHYIDEHIKYGHPTKSQILKMIKKAAPDEKITVKNNANISTWLMFQKIYRKFPKLYHIFKYRNLWMNLLIPIFPMFDSGETIRAIYYIELNSDTN